jgi:hypothetical protein
MDGAELIARVVWAGADLSIYIIYNEQREGVEKDNSDD